MTRMTQGTGFGLRNYLPSVMEAPNAEGNCIHSIRRLSYMYTLCIYSVTVYGIYSYISISSVMATMARAK